MKRYLISGALLLIAGQFLTSCHDKVEADLSSPAVVQRQQEFEKAFKEAFTSKIDPNQDWGFLPDATVKTRSAQPNANQWGTNDNGGIYKNFPKPADITEAERNAVLAVFNQTGAESYTALVNYDKFFVQQVFCGSEGNKMTQLACAKKTGGLDEVNNFNNGKYSGNANQGCMLMFDASTSDWSYKSTQGGGQRFHYFRMEKINGYYYVGLDFASERQASANANEQFDRDYIYNDWIVKIVPGTDVDTSNDGNTSTTVSGGDSSTGGSSTEVTVDDDTYPQKTVTTKTEYFLRRTLVDYGRVFCEDLGGSYTSNRKDFDYNDVVFDGYLWKEEQWKRVTKINTYEVQVYDITSTKDWKYFLMTEAEHEAAVEAALGSANTAAQTEWLKTHETLDGFEPVTALSDTVSWYELREYDRIDTLYNAAASTKRYEIAEGPTESMVEGTTPRFYADICLLAAGGTKPLKVGGSDATEVHSAFGGYSVDCIINTFDENTVKEGGFGYHETAEPVTLDRMEVTPFINADEPLIRDIPIYVQLTGLGGAATEIKAEQGEVPQKFMTRKKDNWTSERFFLGDAYPNFTNWAEGSTSSFATDAVTKSLYSGYPSPEAGLSFTVTTGESSATNLEVTKIDTPYETVEGFVEIVYNELNGSKTVIPPTGSGSGSGSSASSSDTAVEIWSGDIVGSGWTTIYEGKSDKFADAKSGDVLRVTGYQASGTTYWEFNLSNTAWSTIHDYFKKYNVSNEKISEDVILTDALVASLKQGGLMSYSNNVNFTKVELIKK